MTILHYSLGFSPYRTGGMTKFCMDLMCQQSINGNEVALIWPGRILTFNKKVYVKDKKYVYFRDKSVKIHSFEVVNPLPISFDEGITEFRKFTRDKGGEIFSRFLDIYKPDVIHIHTLMGLHKSFLSVAKKKNIRIVFTTHDFFPICSKVSMFRNEAICTNFQSCIECGSCNSMALGLKKIQFLQSPIYRAIKDFFIVKKIRTRHRDSFLVKKSLGEVDSKNSSKKYKKLRSYYGSMLSLMDVIHFNSSVTKAVYNTVFHLPKNCVIGITHGDIFSHKRKKEFVADIFKIRYLGPYGKAKGFFCLRRRLISCGLKDRIFV